ncbi:MAG TPA: Calx-beta domain-containing protein [Thermoanaerobaculia bacterium]|jgi:plastocyanin
MWKTRRFALALAILALVPLPACCATVNVAVGGASLVFTPSVVHIHPGDTVVWTNAGGYHSIAADDGSFNIAPASPPWSLSHTFNTVGTFKYQCTVHGPYYGMTGSVIVDAPSSQPGTLRFGQASFSVNEAAGTATIVVQRINGDDGAVSVQYSATAGTATAGQDFTPVSGTLFWGDKDSSDKSFTVAIANDTTAEPSETVLLALSNPTGGATLDAARKSSTLTIQDNDSGGGGGGPVKAPSNLQATAVSTSEIDLTWTDNSTNETGFQVERRTIGGTYAGVATVGPNTTSAPVPGLDAGSLSIFRVRATGSGGTVSAYSAEAVAATLADPGPCVAGSNVLCVNNNRFRVAVAWSTGTGTGQGSVVPLPSAPDSGLFYFFAPSNIEMLIKVLNACVPPFNHYWVFFAATTNVEFGVVVTDTQNGKTRAYYNPLNRSAPPVQDVDAFATCP